MKKLIILIVCLIGNVTILTAQKTQTSSQSKPQNINQSRPQTVNQYGSGTTGQSRPQTNYRPQTTNRPQTNNRPQTTNRPQTQPQVTYQNTNVSSNGVEQCVIEAIYYLNSIRKNPSAFSDKVGVDLGYVEARPVLKTNAALMKAAQAKAEDMANRNYFAHVDPEGYGMNYRIHEAGYSIPEAWYSNRAENSVESIGCGTNISSGTSIINLLIVDENVPSLGHRIHLLGIDPFYANCTDIGIGHAYNPNSEYKHYWSILIAKHNY